MPFPIEPPSSDPFRPFLIQDPFRLRKQILPLLTVDRDDGFLTGLGTSFLADPFGTYLTAEHVLQDHFADEAQRAKAVATALFGIGLAYGTVGLPSDHFAPIIEAAGWRTAAAAPGGFGQAAPPPIVADVLRFHVDGRKVPGPAGPGPLPVRMSGIRPAIGDRVLAIGFPELTVVQREPPAAAMVFTERMYGAAGTITGLLPEGRGVSRPWPQIEVEADWRSGMSGGPVFNEAGEVIALVSSSLAPGDGLPGIGWATDLAGIGLPSLAPAIDPLNPGWYRGWAVLRNAPWHLAGMFPDEAQAQEHRSTLPEGYAVQRGSNRFGTDDFMAS